MAGFNPDAYLQAKGAGPSPATPSGGFDPDQYLAQKSAAPASSPQSPPSPSGGSSLPEIVGVPDPSIFQRIGGEIRNALSPILGESEEQKRTREASLSMLGNISPTLANYVQDAAPKPTTGIAGKVADMAMQGGGAAAGQAIGAFGGPFDEVTIPLGGAIGGAAGDYGSQKRRIAAGEQDSIHPGEIVGSAIAGAIPGGSLAKTGTGAIVSQAIKQGVGGLASATAQSVIDEKQLPGMRDAAWAAILPALTGSIAEGVQQASPEISAARTAAQTKIAPRAAALAAGQDAGMVVEPSMVNPSIVNKSVESLAGGPSIRQAATHINQEVADNIARRVLDPANPDTALTSQVAQAVRKRAYDVGYQPVASAGAIPVDTQYVNDLRNIYNVQQGASRSFPGAVNNDVEDMIKGISVDKFDAGDAIKMTQLLRNRASQSFAQGNNEMGIAQRQASKAIEDQIERHLSNVAAGTVTLPGGGIMPPGAGTAASQQQAAGMLSDFRDARTLMAQSHDIEDAIREGSGSIIPSVLGAKFQAQKPLSGGLDTIGAFANNFPTVTREGAKTAVPGTTVTGNAGRILMGSGLAGATAASTHSPAAAALAGAAGVMLPSIRGLVRNLVLSGPYQRIMAKIPVNVEANPDLGALVIRQGGQAAALQGRSPQGDGSGQ